MNKSIVLMIYDTWESTSGSLAIMAITDPKNPIGHDRHGGEISPNQVVVYECLWNVAWDNIFHGLVDNTSRAKHFFGDISGWSSVTAN